jgi:hypothetical protein
MNHLGSNTIQITSALLGQNSSTTEKKKIFEIKKKLLRSTTNFKIVLTNRASFFSTSLTFSNACKDFRKMLRDDLAKWPGFTPFLLWAKQIRIFFS